jgi:hypothetical protein
MKPKKGRWKSPPFAKEKENCHGRRDLDRGTVAEKN